MLGRTEEPDTGMLCPQKRTSGTSCDTEGWICGSMRPWDLSWQTSPRIWSVARLVSKLTFWTWAAWHSHSELEDLKWDTTPILLWNYEIPAVNPFSLLDWGTYYMAPFSNKAFTSCSITRTCWGGHLGGKHPNKPGWPRPELYWYPFSIVCRTQWDIFAEVSTLSNFY